MEEKYRWYRNAKKVTHRRKESWFNSPEKEKVYSENFVRIKAENDLSAYVAPKPKPKPSPKPTVKNKKTKNKTKKG